MEIIVILILLLILIFIGVKEQKRNERNIKKIPIRVNVNGIRGKSTATRLISAVLAEAGYNNIGKTTGTAPRMIYSKETMEKEIQRKPRGISISEQLKVINEAAKANVDSLVCECMAVKPEYQKIYQEKMIQANIGVIVNVLEDHLEEMGPTTDEIAQAFTSTIPYNGKLIIPQGKYTDYFKNIAKERNTEVYIADEKEIPEGYLDKFDYLVFPNNIAIPLAFAKAMDIDKEIALEGMLKSNPDPGALIIDRLNVDGKNSIFVNSFAANDPDSTLEVWEKLHTEDYLEEVKNKPLVVFNSRGDRVDRTIQFAKDCIPYLGENIDLLLMGSTVGPILREYQKGRMENVSNLVNLENKSGTDVRDIIYEVMDDRLIFCIGNIHGEGEVFLEAISEWDSNIYRQNLNL